MALWLKCNLVRAIRSQMRNLGFSRIIIIIIVYFRHRVHRNYNKTTQRTDRKHTEIYTKRPIKCRDWERQGADLNPSSTNLIHVGDSAPLEGRLGCFALPCLHNMPLSCNWISPLGFFVSPSSSANCRIHIQWLWQFHAQPALHTPQLYSWPLTVLY